MSTQTWALIAAASVTFLFIILDKFLCVKLDSREPPLIKSSIPYLGHAIHLIVKGTRHYASLRRKHGLPIYTLTILGGRIYVVTSPEFIAAVQRSSDTLSFNPYMAIFIDGITLPSKNGHAVLTLNLEGKEGDDGLQVETHQRMHAALARGSDSLRSMSETMTQSLERLFSGLNCEEGEMMDLYRWTRHAVTIASTDAVYGPSNPFRDPLVEDGFW